MTSIWNFFVWLAETLDPINSLIGLITTIIAGFTAVMVWRESRRAKQWWQEIRQQPGHRPAILVLDLLAGQNVLAQVEHFRRQQDGLKDIPDDRIMHLSRESRLLAEHMPELQKDLRKAAGRLMEAGTDRIHLFLAAPQPAAAAAGAALANMPVTLYHFDRDLGAYVNYGPLRMLQ